MVNDNQYYSITVSTPLLLYGYTKKAQDIACFLMRGFYSVKGYVDVRAGELVSGGRLPVYLPDDLREWEQKEELVIILCLQSILTQKKVVDFLWKSGINKIIYVPDTEGNMPSMMRQIYQKISLNESLSNSVIPKYDAMIRDSKSVRVIKRFDRHVSILCPIQLIYTGKPGSKNSWLIKDVAVYQKEVQKYGDINIVFDKLYGSFFDYMFNGSGDCNMYIDIFAKMSGRSKEEYFRDRIELFQLYEREHDTDSRFFAETAADAKWNPNGYFNLVDGHHRVHYLQKKGHLWIPLLISRQDYELYENLKKEIELREYLSKSNVPAVRNAEIENRLTGKGTFDFQIKVMVAVWSFLQEEGTFANLSYLDVNDSHAFFAINMSRMHVKDVTVIGQCLEERKLLKLIVQLTYQDNILIAEEEGIHSDYDVVFAGEINEGAGLDGLYKRTGKYYFFSFQSVNEGVRRVVSHAKDARYRKIVKYFDGRRWMEYGVLIKSAILKL